MSTLNGRALKTVSAKTADYTVTVADNGTVFTNQAAAGTVVFSLPAATVGLTYTFNVHASQSLRIDPNGTETLSLHTGVMQAAGKYMGLSTAGGSITIVCLKAGEWATMCAVGTWVVEP